MEHLGLISTAVGRVSLSGYQENGHAVRVGLEDAGRGVAGTGAGHGEGNANIARRAGETVCHDCRRVFVAHEIVVDDATAEAFESVVYVQILGARHPEDGADALGLEAFDEELAAGHCRSASATTPGADRNSRARVRLPLSPMGL